MSEFDEKAATWDDDPLRVERVSRIAKRMKEILNLSDYSRALEYGSGTGLLSFALKDDLEEIVLMDASQGMTDVALQKCEDNLISNLHPVRLDLSSEKYNPVEKFDMVFMLLVLHHVADISKLFRILKGLMLPGGHLVIIDLEKEDGSFHDGEFHGHFGFDRTELENQLKSEGYIPNHYEICYEIEKGDGSNLKKYPVFILLAKT